MILYSPAASVTAVRSRSIRTGLLASTVTPGSTAPVVSLTEPAIALCAETDTGTSNATTNAKHAPLSAFDPVNALDPIDVLLRMDPIRYLDSQLCSSVQRAATSTRLWSA